ncbi:DUF4625 domain-containing protein [uncultured Mesonia sp.]|uniref:DUF4625 domain-containing protein n=1 Tax=uncultured Mesonia sp. TaxID=399731 RepID=UPI00374EB185
MSLVHSISTFIPPPQGRLLRFVRISPLQKASIPYYLRGPPFGKHNSNQLLANQVNWVVDQNFSNYTGTTAHFHEHLDVPQNATPGEYHLSISVTDEDGHTHSEGAHFMVN